MNLTQPACTIRERSTAAAFLLVEVVVAIAILALVFGGCILAYVQTANRAEWAGYALAAQGQVIQQLERARAAAMDPNGVVNELTNLTPGFNGSTGFTNYAVQLEVPVSGTNFVWATNYVGVKLVTNSVNPLVTVYMVRVDTSWPLVRHGQTSYFSNAAACYYAEDY
jgi:type II secretory pathway pseudopilin PulG